MRARAGPARGHRATGPLTLLGRQAGRPSLPWSGVTTIPRHQIRASYDDETITVYQAYRPEIAGPAADTGRFPDSWSRERMTWIKPSFRWMMYRSGWAGKPGQERVLALRLCRPGFDWALAHCALSSYESDVHPDRAAWKLSLRAPVRVQWDPERDLLLRPLPHRSIQIGLSGEAARRFADDWIIAIDDVTGLCHRAHALVTAGDLASAGALLPAERPYPMPELTYGMTA
jgi:hypothetical protein